MSYNDRLREAAIWIAAHPGETITVEIPKQALADALLEASEDCRWPHALGWWARDLARKTYGMCDSCCDASVPAWWWAEHQDWQGADERQPTHADCGRLDCTCPHAAQGDAS